MNILVINSLSLPFFLDDKSLGRHTLFHEDILKNSSDTKDYDVFLCEKLNAIFTSEKNFDLIILPYSLNRDNLMEFSGLRLACHIRLASAYRHQGVPFLFMGPETPEEVNRLDKLGSILFSSRVFKTSENEEAPLLTIINDILSFKFEKESLNEDQYRDFLDRVQIEAPSNYGSHHSIANEWAITRWTKMFKWIGKSPEIYKSELSSMLYFNWLLEKESVCSGKRQGFTERNAYTASISQMPPQSKVVYIDDEGCKGWNSLLSILFKNSNAELIPYTGFKKGQTKNELIEDIETFIDSTSAKCFLIDLRLHDDDFAKDVDAKTLTGHIIARYIKKQNKGNQIVVFTASNKTWNYQIAEEIGAVGYALKESPEYNFSREESYENFCHFARLIRKACKRAYISNYVEELRKYETHPLLDNFVDMLLLDEEKTLRANALNLAVFLESYLDGSYQNGRFRLDGGKLRLSQEKDQTKCAAQYSTTSILLKKDMEEVKFSENRIVPCPAGFQYIKEEAGGSTSVMLIALHYYYGISEHLCNQVLKLKNDRNKSIAHYHGNDLSISLKEIREIFEKVILVILEKDKQ